MYLGQSKWITHTIYIWLMHTNWYLSATWYKSYHKNATMSMDYIQYSQVGIILKWFRMRGICMGIYFVQIKLERIDTLGGMAERGSLDKRDIKDWLLLDCNFILFDQVELWSYLFHCELNSVQLTRTGWPYRKLILQNLCQMQGPGIIKVIR